MTDDLVDLLPPLSRGLGYTDATPIPKGPRYARTSAMGRWHRIRSGVRFERWGHTAWALWCGQHVSQGGRGGDCLTTSEPFDGAPVCGTCEGRAFGALQEAPPEGSRELVFSPRRLTPPAKCPGARSGLWESVPGGLNVAVCLACGVIAAVRASGGPYNPRTGLVTHAPGPGLVPGCPFHAWDNLARLETSDGPVARCGCGQDTTWPGVVRDARDAANPESPERET